MTASSYPLPKLEDTLAEMRRVLHEILQSDDVKTLDNLIDGANKSVLPKIHQIFQSSVANKKNWNAEFGQKFMLSIRDAIPLSTAMPFVLEQDSNCHNQVARAASLLVAVGKIYSDCRKMKDFNKMLLKRGTKENDLDEMLLAACRVPGMEKDEHVVYKDIKHVLVISRGNMFTFNILDEENQVMPAELIVNHLEYILHHSGESIANAFALTALPRNEWCVTRLELLKERSNQDAIAKAERAIVSLTLENEPSPGTLGDLLQHVRLGSPSSRYYDKLVNVIVYRDAQAGMIVDHTCADGYVAAKLCMLINKLSHEVQMSPQKTAEMPHPDSLYITTPTKSIPSSIWDHQDRNLATFEFPICSKLLNVLKASHVLDAWLHLSLQLAILELTGTLSVLISEPTYIDNFKNGSTDATFPVSMQSRELIKKIKEGSSFGCLITLLKAALAEHKRLIKNTKMGKAYGSHIIALQSLLTSHAPDHPLLPSLQRLLTADVIMTGSSEGSRFLKAATGNVFLDHQLVITYIVKENEIVFVLTARGRFAEMLPNIPSTLSKSLNQILHLTVCHASAVSLMKTGASESKTTQPEYTLYLRHNANTPGTIILQHEQHLYGNQMLENADDFLSFITYAKSVASSLQSQLRVQRCGIIAVFLPEDKPQVHIIPFHGLGKEWVSVVAEEQEFSSVYKGYVTTVEGPRVSDQELTMVQKKVLGCEDDPKWDNRFHGDPKDDSLFARLVRGELSQWRVWEDEHHIAFLTPFPSTPGFTVVVPRSHLSSDIMGLPEKDFTLLFKAVQKVAIKLTSSLSADGCAVVCEGMEIDYAHVKVVPLYEASSSEYHVERQFHETYPGFVSTKHGPELDIIQLEDIAAKLASV